MTTNIVPTPPPEEPPDSPRIEMHGESQDGSTFTQIGTQIIEPLPPSGLALRYSLPPDTAAFTGRDAELHLIAVTASADADMSGGVVAIHAIGGMPGVGKTALAVHVAHLLRDHFPDRQLFIDLHAHTPGQNPATPQSALAGLLTAVGVDPRYLPESVEHRADLWRDRMAGQRAVLVLDNAASSDQVIPLLPGSGGCLVLVTSRRHLADLPGAVVAVPLDALPPDEAQAMYLRLAIRAAAEPAPAVRELVQLAGYLPLAISLLARVYAKHLAWSLADLIRETKASLLTLAAEKNSVAAAFDVSYRYLPPSRQEFLRYLGLHLGATIDAYAAAALCDTSLPGAAEHLDALHREGLLTETGHRRYGMHDLLRRYARDRAASEPSTDRDQARRRLMDYYQYTAAAAETRLARQSQSRPASRALASPPTAIPSLPDRVHALSWARIERGNLFACLDHVTRAGQHNRVIDLTAAVATLLRLDGPWAEADARHASAVRAARDLGDRPGEAGALSELGVVRRLGGDYPRAAEALDAALVIYRSLDDRLGQAVALHQLGALRCSTGKYQGAAEALDAALVIYRSLDDRLGQANSLNQLAVARYLTGDYLAAVEALTEALGTCRDIGDQLGQAQSLNQLGVVRRQTGDYARAAEALEEALGICRTLGDRLGQANSLNELGMVRRQTGDYLGAAEVLEAALGVCRDLGYRRGQANILIDLGAVRRLTGDSPGASEALESALAIYRDLGDRGGEAEVLNEMGALHSAQGAPELAEACHLQAQDLAVEIGSSWDEAHALAGLGRCALAVGRPAEAESRLRQALDIFHRIGAAEAIGVAAELSAFHDTGPAA
jgi:tetratricopeptide (TPR) repeat protein